MVSPNNPRYLEMRGRGRKSEFLLSTFRISAFPPIFQIVLRGRRNCLTVLP